MKLNKKDVERRRKGHSPFLILALSAIAAASLAADKPQKRETPNPVVEPGFSGQVANGVRVVSVEAFKYGFDPDPIVVGLGEKVRLELKSRDVTHGIGIREYGIDAVVTAGGEAAVDFTADRPGTFHIHCTVFCGPGHHDMHGTLIVKKPE